MPEKGIMAAVLDSEAALHAGDEAVKLALAVGSRLSIVSVVPSYQGNMDLLHVKDVERSLTEPHERAIRRVEDKARVAGIKPKRYLLEGEPYERIIDLAESQNIGWIVLGAGNRNSTARIILGGTAAKVIGYSRCDVLVVPLEGHLDFQRILLATDCSPRSRPAEHRAVNLAADFGGRLTVLNVLDLPAEYYLVEPLMERLQKQSRQCTENVLESAASKDVQAETVTLRGDAYQVILDEARRQNVDLIVLGAHGRSGLRRLLMGRVVERVLASTTTPVLVVH